MSSVMPPGVPHLADMPWTWAEALRMALNFLKLEELPDDERPKREIWLESDLMRNHFKAVDRMRKAKSEGKESMDAWDIDGPSERNSLLDEYR